MKFKSFMNAHSALVKDVVISTCLVGATAGIVFGISAGTFKINYMDLTDSQARLAAFNNPANNYTAEKVYSA
ncbi:MAG: hypothetical protein MJ219_01885 [Mycoplasmoidaceae bacterium]|nr:hypothetical protein [Mycoplasmoidaceae bacterium]